jgi:hypothetical protein
LTKLSTFLLLVLEAHCCAGLRDKDFSSVGRAPLKAVVSDKDAWGFMLCVDFKQDGRTASRWVKVSEPEWERAEPGKAYSFVKTKSILRPCPYEIVIEESK